MSLTGGLTFCMSAGLLTLGGVFTAAPRLATRIFGLPQDSEQLDYVTALGFRDIALAGGLLATKVLAGPRATGALAGASALIPLSDMVLVARRRGAVAAPSLALHAVSAAGLLTIAAVGLGLNKRRR